MSFLFVWNWVWSQILIINKREWNDVEKDKCSKTKTQRIIKVTCQTGVQMLKSKERISEKDKAKY